MTTFFGCRNPPPKTKSTSERPSSLEISFSAKGKLPPFVFFVSSSCGILWLPRMTQKFSRVGQFELRWYFEFVFESKFLCWEPESGSRNKGPGSPGVSLNISLMVSLIFSLPLCGWERSTPKG